MTHAPVTEPTSDPQVSNSDQPITYDSYLHVDALLRLQLPLTRADDEPLFITTHQTYELWFRQIIYEMTRARDAMFETDVTTALECMRRVNVIDALLVCQLDVLDTMTPQGFNEFRGAFGSASGAQSRQCRQIEVLSGPGAGTRATIPTVWDGFVALLSGSGFEVTSDDALLASLVQILRDRRQFFPFWEMCEALIGHDQAWALWRGRHLLLVERSIGLASGSGGTSGSSYLHDRRDIRFFPLLWDARSVIASATTSSNAAERYGGSR